MKYMCNTFLHVLLSETMFIRGCTQIQEGIQYVSNMLVGCESGQIIHIIWVSLWRANLDANCRHIDLRNVSRYTCEMISSAVRQMCHQQNSCRYRLTYPNVNDCPRQTYLPDRPIVIRIDWVCVRRKYIYTAYKTKSIFNPTFEYQC